MTPMTTHHHNAAPTVITQPTTSKGFPVRTNLRAGLAWDDLDDKAKELWGQLTGAVTNATNAVTNAAGSLTGASKPNPPTK